MNEESREDGGCTDAAERISPLNPFWACETDPFSAAGSAKFGDASVVGVRALADDRIETTTESSNGTTDAALTQRSVITWWMKPSLPVIERIHRTIYKDGKAAAEQESRLSDFKECSGGYVARRIIYEVRAGGKSILLQEWVSEDLGETPPTDGDFVVSIPATTIVQGMSNPPPPGTERRLSLTEYAPRILAPQQHGDRVESNQHVALSRSTSNWLLWMNAVAYLLLGIGVWLRWRFFSKP